MRNAVKVQEGTVEQHVADGDTREHENSAKARARNILQGAKPGQATASTEGGPARLGFDALGTQKPVPVSRRTGFANRAVTAIFKRDSAVHALASRMMLIRTYLAWDGEASPHFADI